MAVERRMSDSSSDILVDTDTPLSSETIKEFRNRIGLEASLHLTDHDCLRFLIARNGSMSKATKMAKDNNECTECLLSC